MERHKVNQYGLDYKYFKKNLKRIVAEIDCYTPSEMQRALNRLSDVASLQAIEHDKRLDSQSYYDN